MLLLKLNLLLMKSANFDLTSGRFFILISLLITFLAIGSIGVQLFCSNMAS